MGVLGRKLPLVHVMLTGPGGEFASLLKASGVLAPPADDTAGGVSPVSDVTLDAGGFINETPFLGCI